MSAWTPGPATAPRRSMSGLGIPRPSGIHLGDGCDVQCTQCGALPYRGGAVRHDSGFTIDRKCVCGVVHDGAEVVSIDIGAILDVLLEIVAIGGIDVLPHDVD